MALVGGSPYPFRAYSDPVIFRDDRVLKTLLKKEQRYLPACQNYFGMVQKEVKQQVGRLDRAIKLALDTLTELFRCARRWRTGCSRSARSRRPSRRSSSWP